MSILISGSSGIDMGNLPVSNASQVEVQDNQVSPFGGIKNYIINGNFDIWQYKDALLTYPQTSNGYGSDDRWLNASNTTRTHSQVTCTDTERALFNASKFSRTVITATNSTTDTVYKEQRIEDVTRLAGKTVTLSFWAKADSNKNIVAQFLQVFGTGGSPSSYVNVGNNVIALTNMWQKKTITITIPSIIGKTLGTDGVHTSYTVLKFWFDSGSAVNGGLPAFQSGTFDIAQVQLEEGSVATPFEQRPYGLELSLCQRYAWYSNEPILGTINVYPSGAQQVNTIIKYPVMMRVVPTINVTSNVAVNQYAGNTKNQVSILQTVANGSAPTITSISADAEL